ncbi:MAG: EpsI family protein [Gallionella sp.]|nr:EpsI family protein [Gallionella sp.]
MKKPLIVSLILGMLMVSTSVITKVMTPAVVLPGQQKRIDLETLIPKKFDSWEVDSSSASLIVNPAVRGELDKIYNQTLSRSYISNKGERIMLAIAYGGVQKTDLHAHRPEICYAASGFDIGEMTKTFVDTTIGRIPVMRLVAKQNARNEPITYWIRVGNSLTRGWIEQKVAAISYGLTGEVPDGVLVRVSAISSNEQESFMVQQAFLTGMLQAMRSEDRYWLVGQMTP